MATIREFFQNLLYQVPAIGITDIVDILVVSIIFYSLLRLIRSTSAARVARAILLLLAITLLTDVLNLYTLNWLLNKILEVGAIALIIVFQPELRHMLESVGRRSITKLNLFGVRDEETERNQKIKDSIYAVCKACQSMSESKTGSLIVFEHDTLLGDIIKSGTPVDAIVSRELIGNIFYHGAPLHDGAAVIRDGRVVAAGCVLPLTQKENLDTQLGTRHRAAIGMSEQGDAMIVVTSEETGTISIACKGQLIRNLTDSDLREHLVRYLCGTNNEDKAAVKGIRKLFGGFKK